MIPLYPNDPRADELPPGEYYFPGMPDSRAEADETHRAALAFRHLGFAMQRSEPCLVHMDGHHHGTHVVVRRDDLFIILEQFAAAVENDMWLTLAAEALSAVRAAVARADETGEPPSIQVLKGILVAFDIGE